MKKNPETSKGARHAGGYCKHLRPYAKRVANKGTRKVAKKQLKNYPEE
jgi:hypothetical protein